MYRGPNVKEIELIKLKNDRRNLAEDKADLLKAFLKRPS